MHYTLYSLPSGGKNSSNMGVRKASLAPLGSGCFPLAAVWSTAGGLGVALAATCITSSSFRRHAGSWGGVTCEASREMVRPSCSHLLAAVMADIAVVATAAAASFTAVSAAAAASLAAAASVLDRLRRQCGSQGRDGLPLCFLLLRVQITLLNFRYDFVAQVIFHRSEHALRSRIVKLH